MQSLSDELAGLAILLLNLERWQKKWVVEINSTQKHAMRNGSVSEIHPSLLVNRLPDSSRAEFVAPDDQN